MKYLLRILLTILIITPVTIHGQEKVNIDSLLKCIDEAIDQADSYLAEKNKRIDLLNQQLQTVKTEMEEYDLQHKLLVEYSAFVNDSAIACLQRSMVLAEKMGREDLMAADMVGLAYQYAGTGFYMEAKNYFDRVPQKYLVGPLRKTYFSGLTHLYGELGCYTKDSELKKQYFALSDIYRDSVFSQIEPTSPSYSSLKSMVFNNKGECDSALFYSDKWVTMVKQDTRQYAIMAFFRSEIYKNMKDTEMRKYWLAQSALCDIRNSVMDQSALWSLAQVLSHEDDLDRAHRYIDFSWKCISRFSTHMRGWLVAPVVTMINDNYKEKLQTANHRLSWALILISLLTVVVLVSLINVLKKRRQIAAARNELKVRHDELAVLNTQLQDTNSRLKESNIHLNDSNRVKDEYITNFFTLCSDYINKLESFRIKVNRKMKANQYGDVLRLTSSDQMKEDELREFFSNFDAVFLHIFPTFVDDFNALLSEEGQQHPSEEGRLNTILRIFALIRLGIDESSRIAEFLRYSPNSIYNYRARTKGFALSGRDEFEKRVKDLGING